MAEKPTRTVLIADDEPGMRESLARRFEYCHERPDCPYRFEVDTVASGAESIEKVRSKLRIGKSYDVIVLDIHMEEAKSGLMAAHDISRDVGHEEPVRIIFTGYPNYRDCVKAIQGGAWDYIVKDDVGDTPMFQVVVDSALHRLQQFDQRREQELQIAAGWVPQHFHELQTQYGGQVIALWHKPEVHVIASGHDAFELDVNLKDWRAQHAEWEKPYLMKIPLLSRADGARS